LLIYKLERFWTDTYLSVEWIVQGGKRKIIDPGSRRT
jgi:hypothetical protein